MDSSIFVTISRIADICYVISNIRLLLKLLITAVERFNRKAARD